MLFLFLHVLIASGHRCSFRCLALHQVDAAGAHIALIGDSVAMVVHGHDTTLPITVDEMLMHCRAVARGARRVFRLGDMPFGSYENSKDDAVRTAIRFLKEGDVDAVKLEGRAALGVHLCCSCEIYDTRWRGLFGVKEQCLPFCSPQAAALLE